VSPWRCGSPRYSGSHRASPNSFRSRRRRTCA
jgi:hypothetical protein